MAKCIQQYRNRDPISFPPLQRSRINVSAQSDIIGLCSQNFLQLKHLHNAMACREYLFIKLMSNQRCRVYLYTRGDRLSGTDTLAKGFVRLILIPNCSIARCGSVTACSYSSNQGPANAFLFFSPYLFKPPQWTEA